MSTAANLSAITNTLTSRFSSIANRTLHVARVTKHLAKEVYVREHLAPPHVQQWDAARKEFYDVMRLDRLRHMNKQEVMRAGVVVGELVGFFCIGEVIGRWNLVGYKL